MAITKLMHIGTPMGNQKKGAAHLKNSIDYIMNPDKTGNGMYVGGNSGNVPREVFEVMMDTKREWGKMDKRQGYHFVISFAPGEATADQAYAVIQDFCEDYLGENYDHVFAIHTDQEHMHGHIVFNSVSRTSGYKYRYEKGDWEKYIQPVTDRVCEKHGLPRLTYAKGQAKGMSHAEYFAEKEGRPTAEKIIRADIDFVAGRSETWEDFVTQMKLLGYQMNQARGRNTITYIPPGYARGRRDNKLGQGYTAAEIKERILRKDMDRKAEKILSPKLDRMYDAGLKKYTKDTLSGWQLKQISLFYRAGHYLEQKNPFAVNQKEVRKNALRIDDLYRQCEYILSHGIKKPEDLKKREAVLKKQEGILKNRRSAQFSAWEKERIAEMEERMPSGFQTLLMEQGRIKNELQEVRREKRLVKKIIQEEEKMKERSADIEKEIKAEKKPY